MVPTLDDLKAISKVTKFTPSIVSNMNSVIAGLEADDGKNGLHLPHRLAHYFAQLGTESGGFKYDKEIWGNTPAQQKYDTRTDLGNTKERDGDGKKYMGRSGIQLTGKANYTSFRDWARKEYPDLKVPDFVRYPDKINEDPWEGLVPIWYWSVGNPTRKSLNIYADENNAEMITRRVNGGLTHLSDRLSYYTRAALVLLGYDPDDIKEFQEAAFPKDPSQWDGISGPQTRTKLHEALVAMARAEIKGDPDIVVKRAPVVEKDEVAVTPKGVENPLPDTAIVTGGLVTGVAGPKIVEALLGQFSSFSQTVQLVLIVVAVGFGLWFVLRRTKLASRAVAVVAKIEEKKSDGLPNG